MLHNTFRINDRLHDTSGKWPLNDEPALPTTCNSILSKLGTPLLRLAEETVLEAHADVYPRNCIDFVYFPITAMVSMVRDGVEIATIGSEGMIGYRLLLGLDEPLSKYLVAIPGTTARVSVDRFHNAVGQNTETASILNVYLATLVDQVVQTARCRRLHTSKERCADWLLRAHDCAPSDVLMITQQRLARVLGLQRATVNPALVELRREEAIRYSRGRLAIVNRERLTRAACGCYRVMQTPRAKSAIVTA